MYEHRRPWPEYSLGNPAVARDHVDGKDAVRDKPLAFAVEARGHLVQTHAGPWRQRSVVQHSDGGACRGPSRRRCGRRFAEVAESRPCEGREREHGWLAPEHLRSRNRCQSHRFDLDLGARLISVDLEVHVADTQGRPLAMGDDDLNPASSTSAIIAGSPSTWREFGARLWISGQFTERGAEMIAAAWSPLHETLGVRSITPMQEASKMSECVVAIRRCGRSPWKLKPAGLFGSFYSQGRPSSYFPPSVPLHTIRKERPERVGRRPRPSCRLHAHRCHEYR